MQQTQKNPGESQNESEKITQGQTNDSSNNKIEENKADIIY